MKIKLQHCEDLGDWYSIVRADHDGRQWMQRTRYGSRFMMSERLSPEACIEGTKAEMLEIARAIRCRDKAEFKRCAVKFEDDGFHFWSPKNSIRSTVVSKHEADLFVCSVLEMLA